MQQPGATDTDPQEAVVAVLRTADTVRRRLAEAIEPHGLTGQQYNVLRILRGARPDPLPTLEIGQRMIEQTPGVTRLIDRLEEKGLVRRERSSEDRRVVLCSIAGAGLEVLEAMEDDVEGANEAALAGIDASEVRQLVEILEKLEVE